MTGPPIAVVGIGADGWAGLGEAARAAVLEATTVVGSERQLAMLPATPALRRPLPSPLDPLVDELAAGGDGAVCVLASGDPMLHGIGATLARRIGPERLRVHPHASAFALACARLGWPEAEVELVSAVARAPEVVARVLQPGRRLVAYVTGADGARTVARILVDRGLGPSRLVVLERLGAPDERISATTASAFHAEADPLHAVALEVAAEPAAPLHPLVPGLPDAAYETDGQLTKRHVRAATLAALAPTPGTHLWDVGAGSGSIAIEWLRAEPTATASAIEPRDDRADRIERNATRLGVPDRVAVVRGRAPEALERLPAPGAVFVGGGITAPGLVERCWEALAGGGRLAVNAATLEGEQALLGAQARFGGELARIEISHPEPLGGFSAWRPQLPVVQWWATKP